MIEEYKPGIMTIDGQNYTLDIQTDWEGRISTWDREEKNFIDVVDVAAAIQKQPETMVIGLGWEDLAKLTEEARSLILENGIELIADKTEEAVRTFNILKEDSLEEEGRQCRVAGLFCLT